MIRSSSDFVSEEFLAGIFASTKHQGKHRATNAQVVIGFFASR